MKTIESIYTVFKNSRKICIDSRRVLRESIYFAIKGENFDGNQFAEEALRKGCSLAVVDDKSLAEKNENIVYVPDTILALQELAKMHRLSINKPVFAITGTNGKTTTKELIATVLNQKFRVRYTIGNKNNHIGLPLTILSMNNTTDMAIVEMGANRQGEIKLLCEIALPDYGLITNIGKAHLEGFGSFKGVVNTKAELYKYLTDSDGVIFVNKDNKILTDLLKENKKLVTYGKSKSVYCKGEYIKSSYYAGAKWSSLDKSGYVISKLIGGYNFENILAAITVGLYFGISSSSINSAISSYVPKNYRSQLANSSRNKIILDLYNANPTNMQAALNSFIRIKAGEKNLILGDMLELGKYSDTEHKKILDIIAKNDFEKVYLVGNNYIKFKDLYDFDFFENVFELADYLIKHPVAGKLFLVKGSRGIKLEKCIDYL